MSAANAFNLSSKNIGENCTINKSSFIHPSVVIGNNVKIGGGSGVINDIPDNHQVMGYPAVPLKNFIKQRKNK